MNRTLFLALVAIVALVAEASVRPLAAEPPHSAARDYAAIDAVALAVPSATEAEMATLVRHLVATASDDRERARAIFRWIAHRVDYDAEAFFRGSPGFATAEEVFRTRRAVCGGYARLFAQMARLAGLEVATISGHAKAYDPRSSTGVRVQKHAWNAVRIDGAWHTLDVTWASGYLRGRSFVRHFDPHWFLTPPEQMVFSHLPGDPKWQRLKRPVTLSQFRQLPRVRGSAFALGFAGDSIREAARARRFPGVVETFPPAHPLTVQSAPIARVLEAGTEHRFVVHAPVTEQVVAVDGAAWHPLQRDGDTFSLTHRPQGPDRLIVMARAEGAAEFATFLVYDVHPANPAKRRR
jgi:hypothetical protein